MGSAGVVSNPPTTSGFPAKKADISLRVVDGLVLSCGRTVGTRLVQTLEEPRLGLYVVVLLPVVMTLF